ncbi:hypothetical protein IAT40_000881 [Kwoniella sp. CBS 6097]
MESSIITSASSVAKNHHPSNILISSRSTHIATSLSLHSPSDTYPSHLSQPMTSTSTREPFVPSLDPLTGKPHPNPHPDPAVNPDSNSTSTSTSDPLTSKALESLVSSLPTYLAVGAIILGVLCVIGGGGWYLRRRRRRRRFISFVGDLESGVGVGEKLPASPSKRDSRRGAEPIMDEVKLKGRESKWRLWTSRERGRVRTKKKPSSTEHVEPSIRMDTSKHNGNREIVSETTTTTTTATATDEDDDDGRTLEVSIPHMRSDGAVFYPCDLEDEKTLCGSPALSEQGGKSEHGARRSKW